MAVSRLSARFANRIASRPTSWRMSRCNSAVLSFLRPSSAFCRVDVRSDSWFLSVFIISSCSSCFRLCSSAVRFRTRICLSSSVGMSASLIASTSCAHCSGRSFCSGSFSNALITCSSNSELTAAKGCWISCRSLSTFPEISCIV
ncbi:hypothetical protein BDW59DRAFT_149094, partial [Aspergillus cavernicola]